VKCAALRGLWKYGTGSGASRLVSGNTLLHEKLEKAIARFKGTESAMVYPTGYMANLGAISALVGPGDLVILDRFNHSSIIEASRLSGAKIWVYPHRDVGRLKEVLKNSLRRSFQKKLVITESLFSMDGDIAPLPEISEACRQYGALLMIDEAHATGVLGHRGRGAMEYFSMSSDNVDIVMGTLSKALGSLGGFIAGKKSWVEYLCNKSKSFIYTTALNPASCAAALKAIEILQHNNSRVQKLQSNISYFIQGMKNIGLNTPHDQTPIIPILVGDSSETVNIADRLQKFGIFTPAIRPLTVPEGEGSIRFSLMSTHTRKHLDKALNALSQCKDL
jgi:glycine C-acetyltransferase/8-amino-7-oxononanoate synthase